MTNSKKIKTMYVLCMIFAELITIVSLFLNSIVDNYGLRVDYVRDIAVDSMGMLIGGVLLIGLIVEKEYDKHNRSMFRVIFVLILLFFCEILTSCLEGNPQYITAIKTVNTVAFVLEDLMAYCFWSYIKEELDIKGAFLKISTKICMVALLVTVIADIVNFKFGYYFTVSQAGEYVDTRYEFLGDMAIVTVFVLLVIAVIHKKEIAIGERLALLSFGIFPGIAYVWGSVTMQYICTEPAYLLSVMLIYIRVFSERGKKIARQQVQLTKQSTALMISQIQPHFLYNVLTTISNLCVTDPEEAEETTVLFSQYLRTNLDSLRNEDAVPFSTELGHIRTYVELEKKRFGDILNVEYAINEVNFNVPSLGLQPIVENSIKHGIRGKNDIGHIKISSDKVDGGYKVVIEDDGIGFDMNMPAKEDGRSHVGMINVRERLKQMCNATMTVESSPGAGCKTEIFIPEE